MTRLFNVGDKVVYPMYGAGIIEAIEEKEILGEKKCYYVMRMPIGDMKVMVPIQSVDEIGLRQVVDEEVINQVIGRLKLESTDQSTNWNRRYRANMDKMKSGDIYEIADVVRNLMLREREKGLSTGERKMLENAKTIFISELALAKDLTEEEAIALLDNIIYEKNASI
ncbi:CarD family transcriptional regulator [Tepidibacillus sp. LV47]|uniref:CarD family transcriptional regulator n=1 Tax=Tepidibacillus sp. LV47 TaxID=3398228 RepID=UPI003AAEFAE9